MTIQQFEEKAAKFLLELGYKPQGLNHNLFSTNINSRCKDKELRFYTMQNEKEISFSVKETKFSELFRKAWKILKAYK